MYQGIKVSLYISSFENGNKVNNYTLIVAKNNGAPLVLHFVGYDRLFGSHYDEYDVIYSTFSSTAPDPSVFEFQESKCYTFSTVLYTYMYIHVSAASCLCILYSLKLDLALLDQTKFLLGMICH